MPQSFDPKLDILPIAQQQIWNALAAAPRLGFVLYGGTATPFIWATGDQSILIFFGPSRSTRTSCKQSLRL